MGYGAPVTYDEESGVLQGELQGTCDLIMFEATSVEQLRNEFGPRATAATLNAE